MAPVQWIPVLPKNYRRIVLYALEQAENPVLIVNGAHVSDFSDHGPVTQKSIQKSRDLEVRDGDISILGFHDHPREMWITKDFATVAMHCQEQGWLKIQGNAT